MKYVVMAAQGEYSDRETWIGGVYNTEDEAKAAISTADERRRVLAEWEHALRLYIKIEAMKLPNVPKDYCWGSWVSWEQRLKFQNEYTKLFPRPPAERGEYFSLHVVEEGVWYLEEQ